MNVIPKNLNSLYTEQELSTREIGEMFDVSKFCVTRWLEKSGIPLRKPGHPPGPMDIVIPAGIKSLYLKKKMTHRQIAEVHGVVHSTVRKWLNHLNVLPRKFPGGKGSQATAWKGGVHINKEGRVFIFKPDHLRADGGGYVKRAILVWERHNGPVPRGHIVHHKDEDKGNDNIRNLQAMSKLKHDLLHAPTRPHRRIHV